MKKIITEKLESIERELGIKVLFACESGSRAWGFESDDSDWDVRFIYLHPPAWYLTISPGRDVIELPINSDLDISGWELRKALNLMRKSNPPLLEWLDSPIVYQQDDEFVEAFRQLIPVYFSPKSCTYHYLSMARNNYREHMKDDYVKLKKYLYILRPVLGCLWLESNRGPVPMKFETLVHTLIDESQLKQDILHLVERKKQESELGKGPKIPSINAFIDAQLERIESMAPELDDALQNIDPANTLFLQTLRRLFSNY